MIGEFYRTGSATDLGSAEGSVRRSIIIRKLITGQVVHTLPDAEQLILVVNFNQVTAGYSWSRSKKRVCLRVNKCHLLRSRGPEEPPGAESKAGVTSSTIK